MTQPSICATPLYCYFRPLVKREKEGLIALQARGHVDLILAHREVDQRPALESEQRLGLFGDRVDRQAGGLVLADSLLHRLLELRLQLQRRHRQAVHEQHQIDAPRLRSLAINSRRSLTHGGHGGERITLRDSTVSGAHDFLRALRALRVLRG